MRGPVTPFAPVQDPDWAALADYLVLRSGMASALGQRAARLLGQTHCVTPYVVGIAGSVAVGKSMAAANLAGLLEQRGSSTQIVSTDSFLLPNADLAARGAMHRKGFPESYDRRAMLRLLSDVKAGRSDLSAPLYSHVSYDIVPGGRVRIGSPAVLIVEGINALAGGPVRPDGRVGRGPRDFLDFAVYLDADPADVRRWFIQRLLAMRLDARDDPESFFARFAAISEQHSATIADQVWREINEPNLREHIAPTRVNADAVVTKAADHSVQRIMIRRG